MRARRGAGLSWAGLGDGGSGGDGDADRLRSDRPSLTAVVRDADVPAAAAVHLDDAVQRHAGRVPGVVAAAERDLAARAVDRLLHARAVGDVERGVVDDHVAGDAGGARSARGTGLALRALGTLRTGRALRSRMERMGDSWASGRGGAARRFGGVILWAGGGGG